MEAEIHGGESSRASSRPKREKPAPRKPLEAASQVAAKPEETEGFTKQEAEWFAEGDKPYSEEPPKLNEGEGFTEQDKKWFAEGDKPWTEEGERPSGGERGGAGVRR